MRFARTFLALAALCAAAACADGASRITAPSAPSHTGTWIGSGNAVGSDTVTAGGGWAGSGNTTPPADTTDNNFGGTWVGSGN